MTAIAFLLRRLLRWFYLMLSVNIPRLITVLALVLAVYLSIAVFGEMVVIPILEYFIDARRASGENVGPFEAITVFIVVMTYMVVITTMVVIASLSGWVVARARDLDRLTWQMVKEIFQVKEPD